RQTTCHCLQRRHTETFPPLWRNEDVERSIPARHFRGSNLWQNKATVVEARSFDLLAKHPQKTRMLEGCTPDQYRAYVGARGEHSNHRVHEHITAFSGAYAAETT